MFVTRRRLEKILAARDVELTKHIIELLTRREADRMPPEILTRNLPDNVVRIKKDD